VTDDHEAPHNPHRCASRQVARLAGRQFYGELEQREDVSGRRKASRREEEEATVLDDKCQPIWHGADDSEQQRLMASWRSSLMFICAHLAVLCGGGGGGKNVITTTTTTTASPGSKLLSFNG
jgi:hypothetical protein